MKERPLILVTNDDGITAPGIRHLVESVADLGDVVVVAPDSHQSGMGHAITISSILKMWPHSFGVEGVKAYKTSGTPVDCVKLAIYKILKRKPTILLSGINHGSNSSINVIYSGTMSAAVREVEQHHVQQHAGRQNAVPVQLAANPNVAVEILEGGVVCKGPPKAEQPPAQNGSSNPCHQASLDAVQTSFPRSRRGGHVGKFRFHWFTSAMA